VDCNEERAMTVGVGLGGRGVMGFGLGRGRAGGADVSWWLAGGISAANAIAAYQPKGAASLAASYVNLANPGTYDAAPGVAPTWASGTGWTFNGTQWLNTGIYPVTGYTIIGRYANLTQTDNRCLIGAGNTPHDGHEIRVMWNNDPLKQGAYTHGLGTVASSPGTANVVALAGRLLYYAGTYVGTVGIATLTSDSTYGIGAKNYGANTGREWAFLGDILAVAIYNTTLTAGEVAAASAAMAAL
jgi:hypothetical protein